MFELVFHRSSTTEKEHSIRVYFNLKRREHPQGKELSLVINTDLTPHDVSHILTTKSPVNWYNELIQKIETELIGVVSPQLTSFEETHTKAD